MADDDASTRRFDYSLMGDDHVARYEETDGEVGYLWNGAPCLILHTRGRTTGDLHKFPLLFGERGDDFVLVASKGGAPTDPGWYRNLVAHPDVEVQVKGDVVPVRARTAAGAERDELWARMLTIWPSYADYALRTEREIPVVVLERR
jgi:deazaflavin-dependent oxidoreductase (nitroreductase family)